MVVGDKLLLNETAKYITILVVEGRCAGAFKFVVDHCNAKQFTDT